MGTPVPVVVVVVVDVVNKELIIYLCLVDVCCDFVVKKKHYTSTSTWRVVSFSVVH